MNLNALVRNFINEKNYQNLCDRLVIIRQDGISIYSNSEDDFESASICALVSGVWQAAKSLNSLVENKNDFFEHRLAFDTSASGLYINPINIFDEEYFICAIYKNVDNPAKLKRSIRVLANELETNINTNNFEKTIDRTGYLFKDITDDEIDAIFEVNGI